MQILDLKSQIKFTLVGLVVTPEFQKCLTYIELLHKKYSKIFLKPYIRPMLEFDWVEYLKRAQRKFGGRFWHLSKPLVVFVNEKFLGDDHDLEAYISQKFQVKLVRDYEKLAQKGTVEIYEKYLELGRKFVYIGISINTKVIGYLIFMLYNDLVPNTCKNFIKKCTSRSKNYEDTLVHRIMVGGWIQFGDYTLKNKSRPCENYKIPHNRRGILSMCNNGRHCDNTTQFFVTLNPTPWMDYRYVAFGQLMQGEYVLSQLEKINSYYEHPSPDEIRICACGEITLEDTMNAKSIKHFRKHFPIRREGPEYKFEVIDAPSILVESKYREGLYYFEEDMRPHLPLNNLRPDLLPISETSTKSSSSSVTVTFIDYLLESEREECASQPSINDHEQALKDVYSLINEILNRIPIIRDRREVVTLEAPDKRSVRFAEADEVSEEDEEESLYQFTM